MQHCQQVVKKIFLFYFIFIFIFIFILFFFFFCFDYFFFEGPILLYQNIPGISEYSFTQIVTKDFERVSMSCVSKIRNSFSLVLQTFQQQNGKNVLENSFKLCHPLNDVNTLINWIKHALINLVNFFFIFFLFFFYFIFFFYLIFFLIFLFSFKINFYIFFY